MGFRFRLLGVSTALDKLVKQICRFKGGVAVSLHSLIITGEHNVKNSDSAAKETTGAAYPVGGKAYALQDVFATKCSQPEVSKA